MCLMSIGKTFEHTFSRRLFAPFRTRKRAVSEGLRHARMNVSAGLRHAYATLSLLSRLFLCCKKPATVHYGRRYNRKAGSSPCCQVAENSAKKLKYILAKENTACHGSTVPLAYLRLLAYFFGREM